MKLLNIDEELPEYFYIFVGQGRNSSCEVNYHNYKLSRRIISSGISSIMTSPQYINDFINGDIVYAPFVPNKTTLHVPSSHQLSVINLYGVEYILEYYRYHIHKEYPSRFSCVYAFGDYESCEKASKLYHWDLSNVRKFKLVKLGNDLDNCIKVVKCNMEIVTLMWRSDMAFFSQDERDKISAAYWGGNGQVATESQNIGDGLYTQTVSDVLYEYLIEGVLQEVEN